MNFRDKCKTVIRNKVFRRTAAAIVAVILVLLIFTVLFLDHVVKQGIQTVGPIITGVPVTVEKVSIGLFGNVSVSVKGLLVGNPKGYSSPHALKMDEFNLSIRPFSLLRHKVVIDKFLLKGVRLNYETNLVASNLNDIINNAASKEKKDADSKTPESSSGSSDSSGGSGKTLQLNSVDISDITVAAYIKGVSSGLPVAMVPIHLENLGTNPEGITPAALTVELLQKLLTGVTDTLAANSDILKDAAGSAYESTSKSAQKTLKDVKKKLNVIFGK